MKSKIFYTSLLCMFIILSSCKDSLIVPQKGATSTEDFYKTDSDAQEAIAAVYSAWRGSQFNQYFLKNLLSDDIITGGGARGDNAQFEQVNEYNFGPANTTVSGVFSSYYNIIYLSNQVINNLETDTDIKARANAEAKVVRAAIYFDLVTLWGAVPLVTAELTPSEYQQPNGNIADIWKQIETDYTEAIASGALPKKGSAKNLAEPARLTEEAAIAFLGKAQVFQGKNAEAATTLKKIINPGKYSLYADYENVLRAVADFNNESIFEFNSINDPDNALNQGNTILGTMLGYRSDKLNLTGYYSGVQPIYPAGWGFASPRVGLYNAFVQMEGTNGYRLNNTIKTYKDLMAMTITLNPGTGLYGNEGYFNWKQRYIGSEVIPTSFGFTITANYRVMRYAEVLLLAAEASIKSNDPASALTYVNMVRERAHLTKLGSVTLDDIKKEKRLELCFEGVRFQDLVRWGDAKSALENQGKNVPVFFGVKGDGSFDVQYPYTNTVFGFITGKHELLPFPEHEMNVNKQIDQNNNW
ncbi:RagB/SusD family nutrient uptake outer membrane protein [Albibacterium bauzanense]|uniref:Putative outer membrane starch-binding protein n=1 Tax=Albibacterium bauzanense TaxID=653929 RepID=A0A4R1LQN4_9SPHI|nr:RagB/SusD family nutrient uptake outer membrane protein [Albibacterium bauzanense]TCK80787.1 putative outer membrane starch-binding protein [Albibacterium bauzanense]